MVEPWKNGNICEMLFSACISAYFRPYFIEFNTIYRRKKGIEKIPWISLPQYFSSINGAVDCAAKCISTKLSANTTAKSLHRVKHIILYHQRNRIIMQFSKVFSQNRLRRNLILVGHEHWTDWIMNIYEKEITPKSKMHVKMWKVLTSVRKQIFLAHPPTPYLFTLKQKVPVTKKN